MAEKKDETPEGGPCPPLESVTEEEKPDTELANESDADYDAEETEQEGTA
ncbi:hypothetical protein SEA_BING_3 [Streptomyces phage Bing]|uniref:Uncharacterized protein n=1 Tax=Streptomyces phage Bing TaxID=2079427 RepID=A0A2L1IW97_9CAUD|nr:hypothetical protein [Streptomyces sp. JV178]YP_009622801.1 hypothetical protein FDJ31_gp03 [Streptomyces phage Bing]AVD99425.1 hypothetical protein SEA_BING_3 [Streptomyces phage Bing]